MKVKSQWDFGELFPPESTRRVWTVTELTVSVKQLLERELGRVWVTGEISNLRQQSSGHFYFTLKDAGAQLSCVLFRGESRADRSLVQDGQKVILQGEMTVYEPRGQYQLRVLSIERQGQGALQLAFERLKQKLQAEGLFAPERKRPIPRMPRRVGLVTSPTGAAVRDIIHVVRRRAPVLELLIAPCRVQGDGAASEIAGAIRLLNQLARCSPTGQDDSGIAGPLAVDVILVTRGGGSLEDLWAFNEEIVARAIFDSRLPVVSAVGHEIDFSISDLVADLRAATPSAAAELLTEAYYASVKSVSDALTRMQSLAHRHYDFNQQQVRQCVGRLLRCHPRRQLQAREQRLDELSTRRKRRAQSILQSQAARLNQLGQRLQALRPARWIDRTRQGLHSLQQRLQALAEQQWERRRHRAEQAGTRLEMLSPWHVLARGYSVTLDDATGTVISHWDQVKPGAKLVTRLKSGRVRSVVEGAEPGPSA
jgi:exodeoxyribonuclease VII large subunit